MEAVVKIIVHLEEQVQEVQGEEQVQVVQDLLQEVQVILLQ